MLNVINNKHIDFLAELSQKNNGKMKVQEVDVSIVICI